MKLLFTASVQGTIEVVPPPTPADIPGLIQWLKADAGTFQDTTLLLPAVANSDPIKGWVDQSGDTNNELTPLGKGAASLLLGAQNGLPAVSFDGVSSALKALFTLAQPVTIFGVLRIVTWAGNIRLWDGGVSNGMALFGVNSSPQMEVYAGQLGPITSQLTVGQFNTFKAVYNGASSSIAVNQGSPITGAAGANAPGGVTLGTDAGLGDFAAVDFCEWALWPRLLSPSEESAMWAYERAKYATW